MNKRKRWNQNSVGDNEEGGSGDRKPFRHPPHLKGRAIGMWYSEQRRAKKSQETLDGADTFKNYPKYEKPVGTVLLPRNKKDEIIRLLHRTEQFRDTQTDNSFKRKFTKLITGNIEDKLDSVVEVPRCPAYDDQYQREFELLHLNPVYSGFLERRKKLPSFALRKQILEMVENHPVCVISGETGCGKTTQVPQFILDHFIENGKASLCRIVCTQPRRISAITVAERVAEERAERLGNSVGYQIRMEKRMPREQGSVVFCTTGVVLRQMESDPCLSNVSHIILDEIHERDIVSDFLITLLKQVLEKRKDLRVILMSATLNAEKFSQYYGDCPHLNIPGFTYPVEEFYLEDVLEKTQFQFAKSTNRRYKRFQPTPFYVEHMEPWIRNLEATGKYSRNVAIQLRHPECEIVNLELILSLLMHICSTTLVGAILVFVTGYAEISSLIKLIESSGKFSKNKYLVLPLHSLMPTVNQKQVFDRPPQGVRKMIIATNIAETSITIDDIIYVIDCGKIKISNFCVSTNTKTLQAEWVSNANADQRKGRAGRVQAGVCYHLFTSLRKMHLEKFQLPEILRARLENTILTIKVLQLGYVEPFVERLLDRPQPENVSTALNLLKRLNALDANESLTPLGFHLAKLPMSPQIGKMILLGAIFSCLDPILSVAVTLDFKDPFQLALGMEKQADRKRLELADGLKSDHLVLYRALHIFETTSHHEQRRFCREYFLSWYILNQLHDMKKQFMDNLKELEFVDESNPRNPKFNRNSHNMSLVKAIIAAGLYPNVAIARKKRKFRTLEMEIVDFHPKSVLSKERANTLGSPIVVYHLKLRSSQTYLHDATVVFPLPIIFFGDNFKFDETVNNCSVADDKLKFKSSAGTHDIIKQLRDRLNWFLEYKINHPGVVDWHKEDEVSILRAVMELITAEDIGEIEFDDDEY